MPGLLSPQVMKRTPVAYGMTGLDPMGRMPMNTGIVPPGYGTMGPQPVGGSAPSIPLNAGPNAYTPLPGAAVMQPGGSAGAPMNPGTMPYQQADPARAARQSARWNDPATFLANGEPNMMAGYEQRYGADWRSDPLAVESLQFTTGMTPEQYDQVIQNAGGTMSIGEHSAQAAASYDPKAARAQAQAQRAAQQPAGAAGGSSPSPVQGFNPQLQGRIDALRGQFDERLDDSLHGIQQNAVAAGGLGSSRQGLAQGRAIGDSQRGFADATNNLLYNDWEQQQGRDLTKFGIEQQTGLGYAGLDTQRYLGDLSASTQRYLGDQGYDLGMTRAGNDLTLGQGQLALGNQGQMLNFWDTERDNDRSDAALGASLYGSGVQGPWGPIQSATGAMQPFTGFGTTNTSTPSTGGGWQGLVGGALTGASVGRQMGWW